jgi:hypothetical protein
LLASLWTNLAWLYSPWAKAGRAPEDTTSLAERTIVQLVSWRFSPMVLGSLRLLYYIGLPFAALFWGHDAIVARFLGLQRLVQPTIAGLEGSSSMHANWGDWGSDIGWAATVFLTACAVLLAAGWARRRALGTGLPRPKRTGVWSDLREALYHEMHWAFYRSIPIAGLGLYWGSWAGLLLASLEAVANPGWRREMLSTERSAALLLRAALAVVSCLLFLRTQNLWLAVPVHWGVALSVRRLYPGQPGGPLAGADTGP